MAIILSHPMTSQEIRVLQEFRRLATQSLTLAAIKAIKHPAGGGGEAPAVQLVSKGYLTTGPEADTWTLTPKGVEFLTLDPKPDVESPADDAAASEA
ncbi:MAG TPA: hypothetical protein VFT12_09930 [Thermoanaerobaculia bacterium]|nr:hypothetical protein [Thermoanaerobaculia bacterium]